MSDRAFEASASDQPANPDVFSQAHGSDLPSVDDVLGPEPQKASYAPPAPPQQATPASPKELPTVDDVLGPEPKKPPPRPITGAIAPGPIGDWIFGDTQHSSLARIMGAFGEAVDEGIGRYGEKLAMSEDTAKFLREKGIFNDYMKGQYSVFKLLNETLLRSGAVAVNGAIYGVPALWHGLQDAVIEAGEQAEETRVGKAIGAKELARSIAAVPEAFPDFNFGPSPKRFGRALMDEGRPRAPTLEQAGRQRILANFVPPPLAEAHDLAVIGGGEAEWKGVARHETGGAPVAEAAGAAEPAAPVDIHARARYIDPKTFKEFDALEKRQSLFRKWIEEGGADVPPAVATSLKETETRLRELEPAVTAAYEKAKAELPAESTRSEKPKEPRVFLHTNTIGRVVPEAETQEIIRYIDSRLSEHNVSYGDDVIFPESSVLGSTLAPGGAKMLRGTLVQDAVEKSNATVSVRMEDGYHRTSSVDQIFRPDELPSDAVGRTLSDVAPNATFEAQQGIEAAGQLTEPKPPAPARSLAEQRDYIVSDVKRQLLAQGRPEDEAAAGAQLIADRYETRAALFNGVLGTAEELYNREGAKIQEFKRREKKTDQIIRKAETPAARSGMAGFAEQMAAGRERAQQRHNEGSSAVRIMSTAEKYAGVTEEEFNAAQKEAEAAAPELKTLLTDDDWRFMASPEFHQRELFQRETAPPFYSAVARTIEGAKQAKASPDQWLATIRNTPGVKAEELEWLGLEDWLKEQKGAVTRDQIADYVRANQIEVKEVEKGEGDAKIEAVNREMNAAKAEWDHLSEIALRAPTPEARAASAAAYERFRSLSEQEDALRDERDRSGGETKFERYTLPGGENHRELLLTLPERQPARGIGRRLGAIDRRLQEITELPSREHTAETAAEYDSLRDEREKIDQVPEEYRVPPAHRYGDPESDINRLAHIFMDDRTIDGKRTLLVKEAQSDWHAKGRHEGYKTEAPRLPEGYSIDRGHIEDGEAPFRVRDRDGALVATGDTEAEAIQMAAGRTGQGTVPDAPFKTTWQELIMKRMIRYAAEHGYDQLAWVTGEERAAQYDVSKHIDRIEYEPADNGYEVHAYDKSGERVLEEDEVPIERIEELAGKEIAKKIEAGEGRDTGGAYRSWKTLENLDLKIGGKMHRLLYDEQFPQAANKLGKKFGGRVGKSELTYAEDETDRIAEKAEPVHTLPITDKLREAAVEQGFPLFQGEQRTLGSFLPGGEGKPGLMKLARDADASTFIHESGHDFLEQMMRDDAHPLAPAALKADAQTIRDWLGIKSHQDLNTGWPGERGKAARRAHEKFARGFEQYLRLGYAPSPGLRDVFARFEAWLTKIYTTLLGLGAPISEDIRQVFDRMLAEHPQRQERTVIAPEREAAPSLGERHAAHAETTAPHFADEVASEIQGERDTFAGQNLGEDEHARLEGVDREVGERAPGTVQPAGHANAPGAERPEARAPAEPGGERPGGDQAAAEGAVPPAGAGAGAGVKTEIPDSAAKPFPPSASDLTDKIGNFRIDGLNDPSQIFPALRENVAKRGGVVEQFRRGMSDGDTLNMSLASGLDPAWLDRKKIGDAYNHREMKALEELFITASAAAKDAAAAAKTGDPAAVLKLAEAMGRVEMLQAHVSGAQAEWGRAGGQIRRTIKKVWGQQKNSAEVAASLAAVKRLAAQKWESPEALSAAIKAETGRTLFQIQEMAGYIDRGNMTPSQIAYFIDATKNGKLKQAVIFYYVNSLISGPVTHIRYLVGNALTALWSPLVKTPFTAAFDTAAYHLGLQEERRIFFGEAGAELYALGKGSREGLKAFAEGWRTGNTPHLPGEEPLNLFESQPVVPPIPGIVGQVIGFPGKSVGGIHGFSSAVRYEQEIAKLAYRKAMREGRTGQDFVDRVAYLGNRPPPEMMEAAAQVARKDLYMAPADYASLESKITRFANHNIVTKLILPFTKIGTQIASLAIENSPAGLFMKKVQDNISGKNGIEARNTQWASIIASTALMGFMAELAAEGLVTGAGPNDPGQQRTWRLVHNPYSFTIGSASISYRGLGMLGMQMAMAANAYEAYHGFPETGNEKEENLVAAWIEAFEKSVLDDTWLRGVKDLIDGVFHHEEYGDRFLANMVTNWVPFSIGLSQINRAFVDPFQRETRGNTLLEEIEKSVQAKVPLWSQSLMPRRDQFGEPIPSSGALQNYANDPVAKMMDDLHLKSAPFPRKMRGVELTDQQHDDFSRIAGRTTKKALDDLFRTLGPLLHGSQEDRAKLADRIHATIKAFREEAAKIIMANAYRSENDILTKATQNKAIKKGAAPGPLQGTHP